MSEELKPCPDDIHEECRCVEIESLRASLRASEEKLKVAVKALVYYSHHAVKVYTVSDSDDYEQYDDKETALEALSLISNPALLDLVSAREGPAPMILYCPAGHQHIDEGEWATSPHKTHQCQHITVNCAEVVTHIYGSKLCGLEWRPANFPTVGVAALKAVTEKR